MGLALQLGHRISEDFDFFSSSAELFRDLNPNDPDVWVHGFRLVGDSAFEA
jgi:hypothetical protein